MKKINCFMAEEWIVKALDEGLAPEERLRLDEHLRECPACRRMREATEKVIDSVAGDVPADPGEEFWTRYHQSLAARLREKHLQSPWWSRWQVAAAFVLSGIVIISISLAHLDRAVKDRPQGRQVAVEVVNELADLYGPIQEEASSYAASAGQTFTLATSQASYNGAVASWFEVEDDSDQLFM